MSFLKQVSCFAKRILLLSATPVLMAAPYRLPGTVQGPGGTYYVMELNELANELQARGVIGKLRPEITKKIRDRFKESVSKIKTKQIEQACQILEQFIEFPLLNACYSVHNNLAVAHVLNGKPVVAYQHIEKALELLGGAGQPKRGLITLINDNRAKIRAQGRKHHGG